MTTQTTTIYKTTSGKTFTDIVQCVNAEVYETHIQHFMFDSSGNPNYDLGDTIIIINTPEVEEIVDMLVNDYKGNNDEWCFPDYGVYMWNNFDEEWDLIKSFPK